jgi:hypothetical protein
VGLPAPPDHFPHLTNGSEEPGRQLVHLGPTNT